MEPKVRVNNIEDYKNAGIIFINEVSQHVLAGYQHKKWKNESFIGGIGGGRDKTDSCYEFTALREFLEEVFGYNKIVDGINVSPIPEALIEEIKGFIKTKHPKVMYSWNYANIVLSFEDLQTILNLMASYPFKSEMYDKLPTNVSDLVFNRKVVKNTEVSHLCILPLVKHNLKIPNQKDPKNPINTPFVANNFTKDLHGLINDPIKIIITP